MLPRAIVLNMFYTGLGIARSLGSRGVEVTGLTSTRIYGNSTRYADVLSSPDSRTEPEALVSFLLSLNRPPGTRPIIFPTRDDDVIFLDRFRSRLEPSYTLAIPATSALEHSLDKWKTFCCARKAGVPTPVCWLVESLSDLSNIADTLSYPIVIKPVSAHHWRRADNWKLVGGRKAIPIASRAELFSQYTVIAGADPRVLVQEFIPGGDDALVIVGCFVDASSKITAAFNARKLLQSPALFGTGCIVEGASCPELLEPTQRLLSEMGFSGIAEVEFKWDPTLSEYRVIEVNPRPWDQHPIGAALGVDVIYAAYTSYAGLSVPTLMSSGHTVKWIAEDALIKTILRMLWRMESGIWKVIRSTRGSKVYAIWSLRDPVPFLHFVIFSLVPELGRSAYAVLRRAFGWLYPRNWRQPSVSDTRIGGGNE